MGSLTVAIKYGFILGGLGAAGWWYSLVTFLPEAVVTIPVPRILLLQNAGSFIGSALIIALGPIVVWRSRVGSARGAVWGGAFAGVLAGLVFYGLVSSPSLIIALGVISLISLVVGTRPEPPSPEVVTEMLSRATSEAVLIAPLLFLLHTVVFALIGAITAWLYYWVASLIRQRRAARAA